MRGTSLAIVTLALLVGMLASVRVAAGAVTCGTERWPVKTGIDRDARSIALGQAEPTTIATMRALTPPPSRPQDARVTATETTVFAMTVFITHYKREDDSDYHLVIADADGNTMVAEIPDPTCVKGASPLLAGIRTARSTFDANLHATTSFQEATDPIPVRVVGVGFFDKPAHGKGAPANGIELHPVLSIDFGPSAAAVPAAPIAAGLNDPGFEDGGNDGWKATDGVITRSKRRASHTGASYAWLGGYGKTHTDTLQQTVLVPPKSARPRLSYWLAVDTTERSRTEEHDTLTVEIRSPTGDRLATLAEYTNLDAKRGYARRTFDLSPYADMTVVLIFTCAEDQSLQTSFLIDDVRIERR